MRPKRCARAGRKRDTHAPQHRYRVCSAHELAIVQQGLASRGSTLQLVRLAGGTGAGSNTRSALKTYCLLLNDVLCHRRRLSNSGRRASSLATTTGQATSDVVTNIEWTAEKFRRHVISLCDQIVALLAERNESNGIWFHLDFQRSLSGDVPQGFAERNVIQSQCDPRAGRARDHRH